MKKGCVSSAGFFNLRVLIVTVLCSIGLFLGLLGSGAMDAILAFGGPDVNLITGGETNPRVTQSESAVWGHGNTVVAAYTDSSGITLTPLSVCGVSTSTDGGITFARRPEKFNTGGECYGQASLVYSLRAAKWAVNFLAQRCGSGGIGQWTSPDGLTWSNGSCAFSGPNADSGSLWVDNNPASPFYGRQYVAFNDFNVSGGAPRVTRSTDDGATWSAPTTVFVSFRRAGKITGSRGTDGTVYLQTLEENGGGLATMRQNFIHKSTDGGTTWSAAIAQGAPFLGPGRSVSGYFAGMYSTPVAGYWREMGWGEPAVGPSGVVHYAYTAGAAGDPGNIFYVRSTDTGFTWSAPFKLNTDATTRAQWGASLAVNTAGTVFVSWYDERNTATDALERFGRASTDNGLTWGVDMAISDAVFPKPLQPDPGIQPTFVGVYHRSAFSEDGTGSVAYQAWTDGRVSIAGAPQQDIFFDRIFGAPVNAISNAGSAILAAGANNVLDPGETVTVSLGVKNVGGPGNICTTSALTGTLQVSGGVTNPSAPQSYGALCSEGPGAFRSFTFTVDPALPCGSTVTASLLMTDGVTNYGTLTYTFLTGNTSANYTENFDGVAAPALPSGWSTTFSGTGTACTTVNTFPDTLPNAAFLSEASNVGLSEVTSANIILPNAPSKLSFRNEFNTEPNFDGLVLEVSVNGGAFQDILSAGGSFVSGGYNSTLSTGFMNPLPGRMAWSGLSGGTAAAPTYLTSVVNLPAATVGQNIRLKWRQGSDNSVVPATNPGARIDSITLVSTICGGTAPTVSSAVSRKAHGGAGSFDISLPLVPLNGAVGVECRTGAVAGEHQIVVTFANPVTMSGASVSTGVGTIASSSAVGSMVTLNLAGVTDGQRLGLTLENVSSGANIGNILIPIGLLLGDANGNGTVNASDVGAVKAQAGLSITGGTFRSDANTNGSINATDIGLVKSRSGAALPP